METTGTQKFSEPTKYDSVFWVEVDRIQPNPFQPRREFDEMRLRSLAESIRQYGVLQPLVVTRSDVYKPDGGLASAYELIAGERRLRASKLIGLKEVPVVIRQGEQTDHMKLELAIVENLQREDLNAIDRAKSLAQLAQDFGLTHVEIGAKVGRSREFVSNSIRLLALPEAIQNAVVNKELTEGHARALLMLQDRPEERDTLFKEILLKKTSVRVAEQLARRIATDKIRKHNKTPEMMQVEKDLTEALGTRVIIENRPKGGRVLIEFFSPEDLTHIVDMIAAEREAQALKVLDSVEEQIPDIEKVDVSPEEFQKETPTPVVPASFTVLPNAAPVNTTQINTTPVIVQPSGDFCGLEDTPTTEAPETTHTPETLVEPETTSVVIPTAAEEPSAISAPVPPASVPVQPEVEDDLYSVKNFTV